MIFLVHEESSAASIAAIKRFGMYISAPAQAGRVAFAQGCANDLVAQLAAFGSMCEQACHILRTLARTKSISSKMQGSYIAVV